MRSALPLDTKGTQALLMHYYYMEHYMGHYMCITCCVADKNHFFLPVAPQANNIHVNRNEWRFYGHFFPSSLRPRRLNKVKCICFVFLFVSFLCLFPEKELILHAKKEQLTEHHNYMLRWHADEEEYYHAQQCAHYENEHRPVRTSWQAWPFMPLAHVDKHKRTKNNYNDKRRVP